MSKPKGYRDKSLKDAGGTKDGQARSKWYRDSPASVASQASEHKSAQLSTRALYSCYEEAVQNTRQEAANLENFYQTCRQLAGLDQSDFENRVPLRLREDFCGTAALCRAWCLKSVQHSAIGVDIDAAVLEHASLVIDQDYNHLTSQISLIKANVLEVDNELVQLANILVALNYAVCFFHSRKSLLAYFRQAKKAIQPGGIFICDLFGGSSCYGRDASGYSKQCSNFVYHFKQSPFNPVNGLARCSINFDFADGTKARDCFTYNFRLWNIPDIVEMLEEVGFSKTFVWISENNEEGGSSPLKLISTNTCTVSSSSWNANIVAL